MQEPTKDDEPTAFRQAASFTTNGTAPWNQPQSVTPRYDPQSQDAPWPLVIVLMILAVCALVATWFN